MQSSKIQIPQEGGTDPINRPVLFIFSISQKSCNSVDRGAPLVIHIYMVFLDMCTDQYLRT